MYGTEVNHGLVAQGGSVNGRERRQSGTNAAPNLFKECRGIGIAFREEIILVLQQRGHTRL